VFCGRKPLRSQHREARRRSGRSAAAKIEPPCRRRVPGDGKLIAAVTKACRAGADPTIGRGRLLPEATCLFELLNQSVEPWPGGCDHAVSFFSV